MVVPKIRVQSLLFVVSRKAVRGASIYQKECRLGGCSRGRTGCVVAVDSAYKLGGNMERVISFYGIEWQIF